MFGVLLLAGVAAATVQRPLSVSPQVEADEYQFGWPIRTVAIIGAGPSGLVAYRELTEAGLEARIFERDSVPGGIWHYTENVPPDAPVPNAPSAVSDFVPSFPPAGVDLPYSEEFEDDERIQKDHNAPRPLWESLTSNAPSPVQQFTQFPWPAGTNWELSHYQLRNYVRSFASYLNINSNDANPAAAYNTRVERVQKLVDQAGREQGWRLWLKSLEPTSRNTYRATWWTEDFDAVVVASGKYNAPSMPSIPGLEQWTETFPHLVRHSRQYRRPEDYTNKTVLIVGASVSGCEISRDLNHHAQRVYQSFRLAKDSIGRSRLEMTMRRLPRNATLVGEIKQFLPIPTGSPIQSGLIELMNGTIISGIDSVILATGFQYSFPFLSEYYDNATYVPHEGSAPTVSPFIPLDGSHVRDLYLDIFYIQDPTLAFIGVSRAMATPFSFGEYTTLALAKVWTNKARLPNSQSMRASYEKTVEERGGYGKQTLFLSLAEHQARIAYLIGWVNQAAVEYGGKQIDGLPKYSSEIGRYWRIAYLGLSPEGDDAILAFRGLGPDDGVGGDDQYYDANDW